MQMTSATAFDILVNTKLDEILDFLRLSNPLLNFRMRSLHCARNYEQKRLCDRKFRKIYHSLLRVYRTRAAPACLTY